MVKLGFVVEGHTEKIILDRSDFFDKLDALNIQYVREVINAEGNKNFLPHRREEYINFLKAKGANKIIFLSDMDDDSCISFTKERITNGEPCEHMICISIKRIESWFLSDTDSMRIYLSDPTFYCHNPESFPDPYMEIKMQRMRAINTGTSTKRVLANKITQLGFSIVRAADHPQCSSARYFWDKIISISNPPTPAVTAT